MPKKKAKKSGTLSVRYCRQCEMYHNEQTPHLTDRQFTESQKYDVYHANGTVYFSQQHVEDNYE